MEQQLYARGFPTMSPWWRATLERFYQSGKRRGVYRVGRRGGKSSTMCRVAVLEALYGGHQVPPGDLAFVAIVSVKRQEAISRLITIRAVLDALGVRYEPIDQGVQLVDRPIAFRVFTASIAGVSGPTCLCAICDEVSKWRDADTGANPATEVLASLRPTMATMPSARMFLISSPLGIFDAHAKAFDEGDTEAQAVAHAPSWVANPTLSEDYTHTLEPDDDVWRREYGAIPSEDADSGLLSATLLTAITAKGVTEVPPSPRHHYIAAMDPATRGNAWTLVVATTTARKVRALVCAREWRGTPAKPLDPDVVFAEMSQILYPYGVKHVVSDTWSGDALASIARRHQLVVVPHTLGAAARIDLYEDGKDRMQDGAVALLDVPHLRADLLSVRRRITPTGASIALANTPDGRHSDFAPPTMLCLAIACPAPAADLRTDAKAIDEAMLKRELARYGKKKNRRYWERDPWARA